MKFEQTHWLKTMIIKSIEVMVRDERVYDVNGINLGSVEDLKPQGLKAIKVKIYFYKIRETGTESYYAGRVFDRCDLKAGYVWWGDFGLKYARKTLEKLRRSFECEIVKFEVREVK